MKVLLLILWFPLLISCTNDQDDTIENEHHRLSPVESVEAPTTASLGQEIEVEVHFRVFNGCGQFDHFTQEIAGTTRIIKVQAVYRGNICTQDVPLRTATYKFTPKEKGEHILRFYAAEDQYEVARIEVE